MKRYTVFACETQPIVVEGLEKVLRDCAEFDFAGAVHTADALLPRVAEVKPDIVLVDQSIGLKSALQLIADMKSRSPATHGVLWVNDLPEAVCLRSLQLGARGVMKKSIAVDALLQGLRVVASGNIWLEHPLVERDPKQADLAATPRLTPRELEVVRFVCRGFKNRQIADALSITPGTVKVHLMHVFEKVGVRDRFELAVRGRKLLGLDPTNTTGTTGSNP